MIKIHYHSDCSFFAGCESMLMNFFNSEDFREKYEISFSYAYSATYKQGLQRRLIKKMPMYSFIFPALTDYRKLPEWMPLVSRKALMGGLRFIFNFPLLVYEVLILCILLHKVRPDIIHINNGGYPAARSALAAAISAKLISVPKVVMVVNNMAVSYRHYSRWLDFPVDWFVIRCVNIFITGSRAAGAQLQLVLNLPNEQVATIHNGIVLRNLTASLAETRQRLGLDDFKGIIFGVVALLIPRKGHQVLLGAVLELINNNKFQGQEFRVLIEGDGPLRETLIDFVVMNDLTPWVIFVGNEESVVDFMSALDVLILPSIQDEDLPNVISEAMALGKPVIASRIAGTVEQVISGKTGLLVEPSNVRQLAMAIFQCIDNAAMRDSMGRVALEHFHSRFTGSIALNNYSNLYEKLIRDL